MPGWIDENGITHPYEHGNGFPMISNVDYLHNIAKGTVVGKTSWNWTGINTDIGTIEEVLGLQGGVYYWLPEAQNLKVASTSAEDDGFGTSGTGAYEMLIQGLDANYDVQSEVVVLNGVGVVETTKKFLRVNLVYLTVGAGPNVGIVTIKDTTLVHTLVHIAVGAAGAQSGVFTVPRNKQYVMVGGEASSSSEKGSTVHVHLRTPGFVFRNVYNVSLFASTHNIDTRIPYVVPGMSDLMLTAVATASGDSISAGVYGFYEDI